MCCYFVLCLKTSKFLVRLGVLVFFFNFDQILNGLDRYYALSDEMTMSIWKEVFPVIKLFTNQVFRENEKVVF